MREIDQALYDYMVNFATLMAKAPARNFKYASIFDLYLKEGFIGNPEPYTPEEESYLLEVFKYVGQAPKQKACFYNSQSLALGESLLYAEGQVLNSDLPIPLEHAFNALPSGKVVDVTLRKMGEPNTCDPVRLYERARRNQQNAYIGLPIPADEIRKSWAKTHMSLMLIEQRDIVERIFEKGFPRSWKKGFKNYGGAPSLSLSGCASQKIVGGPSRMVYSDRLTLPSEKYGAEPSRWEYASQNFVGAPSLSGSWAKKIGAEPSLGFYSGSRASKKNRDWPSPWLSGPEEEWLRQPEREDAPFDSTRSPEGDVPPWAQSWYAGVFPMKGKVFYITAYIGLGPGLARRTVPSPVLAGAFPVQDVGKMPAGRSFGSDFMFFPLAAIPVRQEDRSEAGSVVDYLANSLGQPQENRG